MTARERLIDAYAKLVIEGKCSIDAVPKYIRNAVTLKVTEASN